MKWLFWTFLFEDFQICPSVVTWGVSLEHVCLRSSCAHVLVYSCARVNQTVVVFINSPFSLNSLSLLCHTPTCTPQRRVANSSLALRNEAAFMNTPDVDRNMYRCQSLTLAYHPQLELFLKSLFLKQTHTTYYKTIKSVFGAEERPQRWI